MSYSSGSGSYVGIPTPVIQQTMDVNISGSNYSVDNIIEPSYDNSVDVGRSTKRFKAAYIDEINTRTLIAEDIISSHIDSVPTSIAISKPAGRGISGGIQAKNLTWTSTSSNSLYDGNTTGITKYIPELKTWFSVPTITGVNNIVYYSKNGGLSWDAGGTVPHHYILNSGDFAYSKRLNMLVLTLDTSNVLGTGGMPTFYSRDAGLTWNQCTFTSAQATDDTSYHLVKYVDEWGAFFIFANKITTAQAALGFYSIMKSYDGINFIPPEGSMAIALITFNSLIQCAIYSYDFDPSRRILAIGIRNSVLTNNAVCYTKDGKTWQASNTQQISVRDNRFYSKNGKVLPRNDMIDVIHSNAGSQSITIPAGIYDTTAFIIAIETAFSDWGITVDVTHNNSTGIFSLNFAPYTCAILWLTGANNLDNLHRELGFTKTDQINAGTITGTIAWGVGRGVMHYVAYSPPLDLWVLAGANNSTLLAPNIAWSSDITSTESSPPGFWYQPLTVRQFGTGTPIPQFHDCKWIDSFQMFLLLNRDPTFAGNDTKDRSIWFSADGFNFASIENSTSPKLTIVASETGGTRSLEFDNDNKVLIINDALPSASLKNIFSPLYSLLRETSISLPSWQVGVFTSPAIVNNFQYWTVPFDKPFEVAPTGIIVTPRSEMNAPANYLRWFVYNITTTGFELHATNDGGGSGSVQTWSWMAWEKP